MLCLQKAGIRFLECRFLGFVDIAQSHPPTVERRTFSQGYKLI